MGRRTYVPVPESEGGPVHVHRRLEKIVVEGQVLALALRRAGATWIGELLS